MNMIERVARALAATEYGDGHDEPWEPFVAHARAALATMLEPSEGMAEAGLIEVASINQMYRAMIQVALDEGE